MTDFTTTYIVAGGPSLFGFDWARLRDRTVIAVNRAFEVLPDAAVCYFGDRRFWGWHSRALLAHKGRKITAAPHFAQDGVEHYKLSTLTGLDMRPGKLAHGNNSGYAAINLAVQLGAKHIYLLGYDMKFAGHRCHWHAPHPIENREVVFGKVMIPYFQTLVEPLDELNVRVRNASPDSAIRCFPRCTIDDALLGGVGTLAPVSKNREPFFQLQPTITNAI